MICVPCIAVIPETWPILPELLLVVLTLVVAIPVVVCWVAGQSIKHLAVSSWHRLERQECERLEGSRFKRVSAQEFLRVAADRQVKRLEPRR